MGLVLSAIDEKIEIENSVAGSLDVYASFSDNTTTTFALGSNQANIVTATTTDLVTAPPASTQRHIKLITVVNKGSASQQVRIKKDKSATEYHITPFITLASGESLVIDESGIHVLDIAGRVKTNSELHSFITGRYYPYYKIGTASEAVGVNYSHSKDTGFPSSWAVGTSGLAGRAVNAEAGSIPVVNAVTGQNFLVQHIETASVLHLGRLLDVLWVNNGIVVTTTTAQTINSVAFASRDQNGTTNGLGVHVAILVVTATTNAGAIANTTMSYTNELGVAGRTATISSFPATAVIGTLVFFQLQAGDKGVRSIQSITLGTSYVAGAISLIAVRELSQVPTTIVNVGGKVINLDYGVHGVRLYNDVNLILAYLSSATTATTTTGGILVIEK